MTPDEMRKARATRLDRERRRRNTLKQLAGIPTSMVPAEPIRTRLRELQALGWSLEAIAAIHGEGTSAALRLIAGGMSTRCERKFEAVAHLPVTLHVPNSVEDNMWVPALGATRRIRALQVLGWKHEDLQEFVGRSTHTFASHQYQKTRAIDWRIIAATYERLSATPGGSTKTASRARALGYAPPLAWNNIDDPNETPTVARYHTARNPDELDPNTVQRFFEGDHTIPTTRAEKEAIAAEWVRRGRAVAELGRVTGWRAERYTPGNAA